MDGVAVDPTDGDVLVKGSHEGAGWVIGEFTSEGERLGVIIGPSKEEPFGERDLVGGVAVGAGGDLYVGAGEVRKGCEWCS